MSEFHTGDVVRSPLDRLTRVAKLAGRRYRVWPATLVSAIYEAEAHLGLDGRVDRRHVHYLALSLLRRRAEANASSGRGRFDLAAAAA